MGELEFGRVGELETVWDDESKSPEGGYWFRGRAFFKAHKLDPGLSPIPWRKGVDSGKREEREGSARE